jgi:hypothetical protein
MIFHYSTPKMAALYQRIIIAGERRDFDPFTPQNITLHMHGVYEEGDLESTSKDCLLVQSEGREKRYWISLQRALVRVYSRKELKD